MPRIVKFFETTLRDGEQTPGINYFAEEKLEIARALADMGFDTLDCGFAVSGQPEFEALQLIARNVRNAEICSIARCFPEDIDRAWEAVKDAAQASIHPFISTSPLHREVKLGKTRAEVLELARTARGARPRAIPPNVDFALEDTTRTEHDFILEVVGAVVAKRACASSPSATPSASRCPGSSAQLVAEVKREFPDVRISAHCHDDLGLAVANALSGLINGAERVDTCINGLGERAGNAATEDVVMAIRTRRADLDLDVTVDTTKIIPTSRLVARLSGMQPQWTKSDRRRQRLRARRRHPPGRRAQRSPHLRDHAPGGYRPAAVGAAHVVGKLSGRAALNAQLKELGYDLSPDQLARAFPLVKLVLGKKKVLEEMDLRRCAETAINPTAAVEDLALEANAENGSGAGE